MKKDCPDVSVRYLDRFQKLESFKFRKLAATGFEGVWGSILAVDGIEVQVAYDSGGIEDENVRLRL